jgi:hypothetical protein
MTLYIELPVYRDRYKLVLEIFISTKHFPKEYKYSLGRDMERTLDVYNLGAAMSNSHPVNSFSVRCIKE